MSHARDELKTELMKKAEAAIEKLLEDKKPPEEITLTDIEQLGMRAGEAFKAELTQTLVEASADRQQVPEPACPACGKPMRYKGHKPKRVVTETGEVTVERAYYHCAACQQGFFPLDERWGLSASHYSDGMNQQMVWLSGLVPSYAHAAEVCARIGPRCVPGTTLWRRTQGQVERERAQVVPERVVLPGPGQEHPQVKGVSLEGGGSTCAARGGRSSKWARGATWCCSLGLTPTRARRWTSRAPSTSATRRCSATRPNSRLRCGNER